jgi:HEAT repeat protein
MLNQAKMRKIDTWNGVPVPHSATVAELCSQIRPAGEKAWVACIALGCKGGTTAFETLFGLLNDSDWRYRRAAVEALTLHPDGKAAAKQICGALRDRSPYVVRTACKAATELRIGGAHEVILELLRDEDASTRQSALGALVTLWKPSAFELVYAVFRSDSVQTVRREAAWTLKAHASPQNWRALFEVWFSDPLPRHRLWAYELASAFGDAVCKAQLSKLLQDPNGHVRKAAQDALHGG